MADMGVWQGCAKTRSSESDSGRCPHCRPEPRVAHACDVNVTSMHMYGEHCDSRDRAESMGRYIAG